jgi:Uma2 family endonuclease
MIKTPRIPSAENPFADRKRWTADECRKLEAMEILVPGTYELIDGEIVEKVGQNLPHGIANTRTFLALTLAFGQNYVMMPVSVAINDEDRPEPDVFVTILPVRDYMTRGGILHPADMHLIVEVSDTTLWRDCNTKMKTYAAAGIPEYWVVDINARKLRVHRTPEATGYKDIVEYTETQSISPLAAPDKTIAIADLLP